MKLSRPFVRSKFTDERLIQYLLGTGLTSQEREEIEDSYFRDDDTFRRAQEIELELVEAYKSGQLTEERRKLVSDLVARSGKLQEYSQFAEALKRVAFRTDGATTPLRAKWMRAWLSFWGVWKFASAIATMLMIPLVITIFVRLQPSAVLDQGAVLHQRRVLPGTGLTERLLLGDSDSSAVGREAEFVDLVLPEQLADCALQRITVNNIDRNEEIPRDRLRARYESADRKSWHVVVSVSGLLLTPGTWRVAVNSKCGTAAQTKTVEYKFVVP